MELHLIHVLVLIAALGITAQWLAWRLNLPAIVLLLIAGLVAGPGLGWIEPSTDLGDLLPAVIQLGVAIILFDGGLNLKLHELKQAASGVRRLVFLGAPLAWVLGSSLAHYVGELSWPVSLLFGAITVVTGPTVIMPLLRQARLKQRPASFLKWEGIINDPIGALLAVIIYEYLVYAGQGPSLGLQLSELGLALVAATALGAGASFLLAHLFRQGHVPEFLKPPLILSTVIIVYVIANLFQDEAGLLATTVMGVVLGNSKLPSIDELRRFKESITILLVSGVFILLTADMDVTTIQQLDWHNGLLIAGIIFAARPITVFVSTLGTDMSWQERSLVAWIAPRGIVAAAVAGVFAPALVGLGYTDAQLLLPLVFSLIIATVFLHGFSIGIVARRLDLAASSRKGVLIVGASPWSTQLAKLLKDLGVGVLMVDSAWHRLRPARLDGIPVYFGEMLSESAEERLETNNMGYLLATTENDAYNALVCTRLAPELGRSRIFQLPMAAMAEEDPKSLARTLRGNIAFSEEADYQGLLRRHYQGWVLQKTSLTEAYNFDDYSKNSPDGAIAIFLMRGEGKELLFHSAKNNWEPTAGDTLVAFVPPSEPESRSVSGQMPA
ncbi:MAG TPA: sodium:proton antiporter [Acidiferrobacteraceae bacterium]|nr:sodium:proton antiporter [Acidiferrobacteraceae bacterium]